MFRLMASAATALALACGPASATDLRLLSSWDSSNTAVELIAERFVTLTREASDGATSITITGPEAVPPFEQLNPVSLGLFDMLFTHGGYHANETGIGLTLDSIDGDPDKRRESGVWDYVDQYYQDNHNLKLISIPTALTGYRLYLREPMEDSRLDGLKIRALSPLRDLVENLGGASVVLPSGEMYAAAERGIVDGIIWPAVGAVGFNLCEVTPHIVQPSFGNVSEIILMNLGSWERLGAQEQEILLEAGRQLEHDTVTNFAETLEAEDAIAAECGASHDPQSAEWGEQASRDFATRVWEMAGEQSPQVAEDFRVFAVEKGMTW